MFRSFSVFFLQLETQLEVLKVNFLENNLSESREAQKAINKPSPMGLGTLRSGGGGRAKRPVHESDIMNKHRRNPECSYKYSVVPGTKSPNRNGIWEFWPEFRRNLQPRWLEEQVSWCCSCSGGLLLEGRHVDGHGGRLWQKGERRGGRCGCLGVKI
jgi:hypothetical protein